ncbi:hypothetical protein [Paenibacillus sp. LK1]|uniref:hypothetical protein n=1 Tax=Paenibacillus sp. LK1 TaxID=2053014 RepID=UPI000C1A3C3B|nr:hypothetical protein [Paenibacillus sp. LK1]PIH59676.1 hypothetical protein CS562_06980 [Paenibacillus sp. LK1]
MFTDGRYGNRDILDLQIIDFVSSTPLMKMDYANTSSLEMASSRVYAMGAGTRRIAWDGEKTATLTVETQIFSLEHLAILAGEEIKRGKQNVYKTEILQVGVGNTVTLKKVPVGDVVVFPFVNGLSVKENQTHTVSDKTITIGAGATVQPGDEVEVYYQTEVAQASKLSFTAKGFPKYVKLVGDTIWIDETSTEEVGSQMVFYKAKIQPNFTISNSAEGDPSTLTLVFDLFPAKVEGVDTLIDLIVYDDQD